MMDVASDDAIQAAGLRHAVKLQDDPFAPLIYLVHGRAGNVRVMSTFKRCIPGHFSVIALEAAKPDPLGGFSWWPVEEKEQGYSLAESAAEDLLEVMHQLHEYYELQPSMLVSYGFSQGSALLSLTMQMQPALWRGVAILSGFSIRYRKPILMPEAAISEVFWAHGSGDPVVPLEKARRGYDYLVELGFQGSFVVDDVTHKVGREGMRGLKSWTAQLL